MLVNEPVSDSILDKLLAIFYLALFPGIGILVSYIGFCDPDTCWHLALGQWFWANGHLPFSDPFSSNAGNYAFAGKGLPLMQHEWLSEVAFFGLFKMCGNIALLVLASFLSISSLVLVPTRLLSYVPERLSKLLVILLVASSAFRLWVRPEQFSFLLMGLTMLVSAEARARSRRARCTKAIALFAIMAFWVNLHGLFFVGLFYLATVEFLEVVNAKLQKEKVEIADFLSNMAAAFLGALCSPWGIQLWFYVIKFLFSPLEHVNRENGPITLSSLLSFSGIALVALLVTAWIALLQGAKNKGNLGGYLKRNFAPIALATIATLNSLLFHRLAPLALLVLIQAVRWRFAVTQNKEEAKPDSSTSTAIGFFNSFNTIATTGTLLGMAACVLTSMLLVPPTIPSESHLFHPPFAAFEYLKKHHMEGRLFNDAKFGSMMTWDLPNPPDLFLDGRVASYDRQAVHDYRTMLHCDSEWQSLLEKYQIAWVFFPPGAPIVQNLEKSGDWSAAYSDDRAVILVRR